MNTPREFLLSFLLEKSNPDAISRISLEEWNELIALAHRHRIIPLLYPLLKKYEAEIPKETFKTLRKSYLRNAIRNMELYRKLKEILTSFLDSRFHGNDDLIPAIVLKGGFLAEHIYKNIAYRSMSDMDLLVKKEDLKQAGDILLKLGFKPLYGLEEAIPEEYALGYYNEQSNMCMELHWNLTNDMHGIHPDLEGLWKRAVPMQVAGVGSRVLSPEDIILHLCHHSADHVFNHGLRSMYDIRLTILHYQKELNWEIMAQRAHQWKATHSLYVTLMLAKKILEVPIDSTWLELVRPKNMDEKFLSFAEECLFTNTEEPEKSLENTTYLVALWKEKSWLRKFARIFQSFFPTRSFLVTRYFVSQNSWRIFLYYPVRIKDLWLRYGRIYWDLITGKNKTVDRANRQYQNDTFKEWLLSG